VDHNVSITSKVKYGSSVVTVIEIGTETAVFGSLMTVSEPPRLAMGTIKVQIAIGAVPRGGRVREEGEFVRFEEMEWCGESRQWSRL